MERPEAVTTEWKIGIAGAGVVVAGMLVFAIYGKPAYAFYGPLKCAVVVVACLGCWALITMSKRFLPVTLCLGLIGLVQLAGKMRKHDWFYFDWAALILMLVLVGIMLTSLRFRRHPVT